jgi:ABC-type Fe3+-siderophore transport system permease subunit
MDEATAPADPRPLPSRAAELRLGGIAIASGLALAASLLASFRLGFAEDAASLVAINGARVLLGAAAGALLATAGSLRLAGGSERPLRELEWFAASVGAAAGGFAAAARLPALPSLVAFGAGAVAGGLALLAAARWLDRPRRASNLGVALLLALAIGAAALAGTYVRERRDALVPIVRWLLGDLGGASVASGAVLAVVAVALAIAATRARMRGAAPRVLERVALGVAVGAVGPLAFVGAMVPRAVGWLAAATPPAARLATSAFAGAATVAAIDAVPRLLVGGYDFPFNVPAGLLAIPIYLGWNRARLRREVGPAPWWLEALELLVIAAATLAATALAVQLTTVIHAVT